MAITISGQRRWDQTTLSALARLDRGWGYTTTEADSRTGIARLGLTSSDMTLYTGPSDIPSGATLDKKLFTSAINMKAGGIAITNSLFRPTADPGAGSTFVTAADDQLGLPPAAACSITDCTFDGSALTVQQAAYVTAFKGLADVIGCSVHDWGSGICIIWTGTVSWGFTVASNRVYNMLSFGDPATTGNHCDGFTVRDFPGTSTRVGVINYNWVDCVTDNASGAAFIQAYSGNIAHLSFSKNLWASNNWCVSVGPKDSSTTLDFATVVFDDDRMDVQGFGDLTATPGYPVVTNCYRYAVTNPPTYQGIAV